jgi:putative Mn2+ efflux pump MntP
MAAGMGCAVFAAWIIISLLQLLAVAAQVQDVTQWNAVIATVVALVLTFIPVVGSVIAFFGAMDVWNWAPWLAALVFLTVPVIVTVGAITRFLRRR